MPRIHILGGPASGKTTLARQLASQLNAPAVDLDHIAYASGRKRDTPARLSAVRSIVQQPDWITEGIYLWWVDDLLRSADVVVWLDVTWPTAARRIVARHVRASLAGTNQHPGLGRLLRFLISARRYYADSSLRPPAASDDDGAISRARTARALLPYRARLVRCRDLRATAEFRRAYAASR